MGPTSADSVEFLGVDDLIKGISGSRFANHNQLISFETRCFTKVGAPLILLRLWVLVRK